MIQMNLFRKQKQNHRLKEWIYDYQEEMWRKGINWGVEMDMYMLLY